MSAKTFPTLHVASAVTGIAMCEGMNYSSMQEIASHLFGASIWTHELAHEPTKDAYAAEGYRQFPNLPTEAEARADWHAAARKALDAYGETLTVEAGNHGRREAPTETLTAMLVTDGGRP